MMNPKILMFLRELFFIVIGIFFLHMACKTDAHKAPNDFTSQPNAISFVINLQSGLQRLANWLSRSFINSLQDELVKSRLTSQCRQAIGTWMDHLVHQEEWAVKSECFVSTCLDPYTQFEHHFSQIAGTSDLQIYHFSPIFQCSIPMDGCPQEFSRELRPIWETMMNV